MIDKCYLVWKMCGNAYWYKNNLYTYNMNNATLKTVDVLRDLGVINNKNGKDSEQCLMAAKKTNCVLVGSKEILSVRTVILS